MLMVSDYEREVKWFLGPKGPLAESLERYEDRPDQIRMAGSVLSALEKRSILIVEAGTGTGKTLAYLVPAIYSGGRVVISTGTKALQEQLVNKDLPVLTRRFKIEAAVMKGRNNYLCRRRYREFGMAPTFRFREEIPFYERVRDWASATKTGDRAEIRDLPDEFSAWREISSTSEQCVGQKCEFFDDCFVTRMRARAQMADVVVVNHHLFFANMSIPKEAQVNLIPSYQAAILDEAHGLAETAAEYFGAQVSTWRVDDLARDIRRMERIGEVDVDDLAAMLKSLETAEEACRSAFKTIARAGARGMALDGARFSIAEIKDRGSVLEESERASTELLFLARALAGFGRKDEYVMNLAGRAQALSEDFAFIITRDEPDHVYWAETRGRGVILRASPIELGPIMEQKLFSDETPIVFTSATLAVQDKKRWSYSHFKSEIGLEGTEREVTEIHLPSSYDWKKQAILYVPRHLPDPSSPDFIVEASREMLRILRISKGRAFLLFTSYRNLEAAHELLEPHLDFPALKQGDAPKGELLEEFRRDESSVLFATQSFWEGVDVAGKSLSCVIVDKLPFASPGDPLTSAKIERVRKNGGNPFMDFQLPRAVISLKQGLGRLIRSREDYGVLAVLDGRLHKKRYGKTFLDSLPPAPITDKREDLAAFMEEKEGGGKG